MRVVTAIAAVAAICLTASAAAAQTVPTKRDQVAYPGGQLPGQPKVALVKIADVALIGDLFTVVPELIAELKRLAAG